MCYLSLGPLSQQVPVPDLEFHVAFCDFLQLVFSPIPKQHACSSQSPSSAFRGVKETEEGNCREGQQFVNSCNLSSLLEFSRLKICITAFVPPCLSTRKVFICSPLFWRTEN